MTSDTRDGNWPLWQRLGAEFAVVVVGVLSATAEDLTEAILVDQRAREGADRAIEAINAPPLPPSDSLVAWTAAATNSSASFALRSLEASLQSLLEELNRSSR